MPITRRRAAALLAVVAIAAVPATSAAVARPAPPAQTASLTSAAKFAFHAGLAFGAFRHLIYKPYKAGDFTKGGFFHKLEAYTKAGIAALFIYHEAKLALADARQTKALHVLVSPITKLVAVFSTLVATVKHHGLGGAGGALSSADGTISSLQQSAQHLGAAITDSSPSASQLLAGVAN